jgi:hypothetical protein
VFQAEQTEFFAGVIVFNQNEIPWTHFDWTLAKPWPDLREVAFATSKFFFLSCLDPRIILNE